MACGRGEAYEYVPGDGRMVSGCIGRGAKRRDYFSEDSFSAVGAGKVRAGDCRGNGNLAGRSKRNLGVKV